MEQQRIILSAHAVEIRLQDCRAHQILTVFGVYMPGRGLPERIVRRAWEELSTAIQEAEAGRMLIGDLNAEFTSALNRENRAPSLADQLLQELAGEEFLVDVGPQQATYQRAGIQSQIDHILCDPDLAPRAGNGQVQPGQSKHDHSYLQVDLLREVDIKTGPARPKKPPLWKLGKKDWAKFEEESVGAARHALSQLPPNATEAEQLQSIEAAWMKLAERLIGARKESVTPVPGSGHRGAEERLRSDIGRWQALIAVITERDHTHP